MIKSITVENLYGEFNHYIELKNGNITLILGENGLGKTIVLKMIKYLFDNDLYELGSYEFSNFRVSFEDNSILEITKELKESTVRFKYDDYILNINYRKLSTKKPQKFQIKSDDILESYRSEKRGGMYRKSNNLRINNVIRNYIPVPIDYVGQDRWLDINSNIVFNSMALIERYSDHFPKELVDDIISKSIPGWYVALTKTVNVKLVETQRLLTKISNDEKEYRNTVEQYSNELKEIIRNKAVEATNLSTRLDRTYTNRLIAKITSPKISSSTDIGKSLKNLEIKRTFLIKVGLLEPDDEAIQPINLIDNYRDNETLRDVLNIYIDDSNQKLSIYLELSEKLNILIDIINKRFNYKEFYINKNEGFVFKSLKTNKKIPLTNLSSGEQHELVLFYELLFNTPSDSLILIDEPEISLHITWQNEFINDLRQVSNLINIKSVIATHSPDIINGNWDFTIELS